MNKKEPYRYEEPRYRRILSDVYNDLGENYDKYAKINIKAEEYYNKAIEADPEYGKSYYNLGNFALKHKVDFEAALSNYLEAESKGYENDTQTFNLGWLYYKKADYLNSFNKINSLLEKYPENTNLKFMIGTIFYKLENYDLSESMQLELFSHFDDLKQVRSPLEMSKDEDKTIVNMLVRVANNLGCAMQRKFEQTRNSSYLVWAIKYFSVSIENLGKLNEIPDIQQNANKDVDQQLEYKKFNISNANQNLRMVLYPKAGLDDPILFEDFPLDYQSKY
jgi:tetratricopeptide (TPR) repeat protein